MRETIIVVGRDEDRTATGLITLTADFHEFEDVWVGTILELGVSTFAETLDETRSELKGATLLQLNEVDRLGHMDQYLKEQGVGIVNLSKDTDAPLADKWALAPAGAG